MIVKAVGVILVALVAPTRSATTSVWNQGTARGLELCPIGSYAVSDEECSLCPPGHYQDEPGQMSCMACNATLFHGYGANSGVDVASGKPLCAVLEYVSSPTTLSFSSPTAPSSLKQQQPPEPALGALQEAGNGSRTPSLSTHDLVIVPSNSPSRSAAPSPRRSVMPSATPSIGLNNAAAFDIVCVNSTVAMHGTCIECPISTHWTLVLAYCLMILALVLLFRLGCSAFFFCSLDFFQTFGLLSLVRNVTWLRPLSPVLRQLEYWAALDWLGVFPCITSSIQGSRLVLIALPFLVATVPLDICQLVASMGICCKSYHSAQEWIHRFIYQWSILLLLLTLQSVAVTTAEAVLCQGVDGGLFCRSSDSWFDRAVPYVSLLMGVFHVGWLLTIIWRKRNVTISVIQRIFRHWLCPVDFVIRKVVIVVIAFVWEGSKAVHLIVAITVACGLIHLVLRPYGDDHRPGRTKSLVSICFMACLLFLSLIQALQDRHESSSNEQDIISLVLGSIVLALMFGPFFLGLLWYLTRRPLVKVNAAASDNEGIAAKNDADSENSESNEKDEKPRVFDDEVYAEIYKLEEQGNQVDVERGKLKM